MDEENKKKRYWVYETLRQSFAVSECQSGSQSTKATCADKHANEIGNER